MTTDQPLPTLAEIAALVREVVAEAFDLGGKAAVAYEWGNATGDEWATRTALQERCEAAARQLEALTSERDEVRHLRARVAMLEGSAWSTMCAALQQENGTLRARIEALAGQEREVAPDMYWAESNLECQAESPAEALSEDLINPGLGELVRFRCAKSLPDEVWQAVAGDDLNTGQPCRCGQRPSCGDRYLEEGCHAGPRKVMVRAAPSAEEPR